MHVCVFLCVSVWVGVCERVRVCVREGREEAGNKPYKGFATEEELNAHMRHRD